MAKVAFVLAAEYEDDEFKVPYDRLREAGHEVTVVGKDNTTELRGHKGRETFTPDVAIDDVDAGQFDALVVPGGYSPDKLRSDARIVDFTRKFFEEGKPVAAICHAGSLLIDAEAVDGRTVTSWPSIRKDLENAGANWVEQEVVVDGNLITSRNPGDLPVFVEALLKAL